MDFERTEAIALGYMSLLNHLNTDVKLKLISKLSESIFYSKNTEEASEANWKDLFGAWKDMEENVVDTIRSARFSEREVLNFDDI